MKRTFKQAEGVITALVLAFAGTASAADALSNRDKEFIKNAAEMGISEVESGKLAEQKASSPDLKKFGQRMVADHTKANDELMALAKSKGVEVKTEPAASQKKMLSGLAEKSGAEFDKEYREHQIKDHEKAVKEFSEAAKDAKDADVKAFAAKHLPHLQEHLALAKGGDQRTTKATEGSRGEPVNKGRGEKTEGQVKTP